MHARFFTELQTPRNFSGNLETVLQWIKNEGRERFLVHGKYFFKLKQVQSSVNYLYKNDELANQIEQHVSQAGCKQSFKDLLLCPFQRICRYPLLLERLRKMTPQV